MEDRSINWRHDTAQKKARTANRTFAIGGVSYSADSFVVAESSILRINICADKPAHRKSANHYASFFGDTANSKLTARNKREQ
jgi:hypothetical protein